MAIPPICERLRQCLIDVLVTADCMSSFNADYDRYPESQRGRIHSDAHRECKKLRDLLRDAQGAIPGVNKFIDPLVGGLPGKWTSELNQHLANLTGMLLRLGWRVAVTDPENYKITVKAISDSQCYLGTADYSAIPEVKLPIESTPPIGGDQAILLRLLHAQPESMMAVVDLPVELLNTYLLTVMDADKVIEFGHRNHCRAGGRLILERGWDFVSIAGPDKDSMARFIKEALEWRQDEQIRPHVRLTWRGRIEASRLALAGSNGNEPARGKPPVTMEAKNPASPAQQRLWDALFENCLSAKELVNAGAAGSESSAGNLVRDLREQGFKIENRKGGGYYRPDAPPKKWPT